MKKQLIRIAGMLTVGLSVHLDNLFLFLLLWCIGWFVYDLNNLYEKPN